MNRPPLLHYGNDPVLRAITIIALLAAVLMALVGCAKGPSAPTSRLSRADAKRAAQAVAQVAEGRVCAVAPTGSMRPTFDSNSYLVTETVVASAVRVGDIIVRTDGVDGRMIVHRVVRIDHGRLVTRGDSNADDDPGFVEQGTLSGRVVAVIYHERSDREEARRVSQ